MSTEQEVRYKGELLGFHPSREAAESHVQEHHTGTTHMGEKRLPHHVENADDITIEPRRPIELHCRGNLVDTFHTREGAEAKIVKLIEESDKRLKSEDFEITSPEERITREAEILSSAEQRQIDFEIAHGLREDPNKKVESKTPTAWDLLTGVPQSDTERPPADELFNGEETSKQSPQALTEKSVSR